MTCCAEWSKGAAQVHAPVIRFVQVSRALQLLSQTHDERDPIEQDLLVTISPEASEYEEGHGRLSSFRVSNRLRLDSLQRSSLPRAAGSKMTRRYSLIAGRRALR